MATTYFESYGEWVVTFVGECTCYGGGPYGHEPGCGWEPCERWGANCFDGAIAWDFSEADRDYNPPNPPIAAPVPARVAADPWAVF